MADIPVAIVTGGAQGLGKSICLTLLKNNYKVCVADIKEEKGYQFLKEQQQLYDDDRVMFCHCDVTHESHYKNAFESVIDKFGRVDVLVNNAGISCESNPKLVIDVNLMGPMIGCRMAMQYMGKSHAGYGGVVINVASIYGLISTAHAPSYVASKHGVVGLTRSLGSSYHLEREGIVFAALCPSFTDTDLLKVNQTMLSDEEYHKNLHSLSTRLMSPDYVAEAVMKILHDRYNGSILIVNNKGFLYDELKEELKTIDM